MFSLMEDLKQGTTMTTVGKHRWGAGQSSSDAFVRDLVENNQQVKSEGRAIDFGDLVPYDCVLRRVSEELFNLSFPALTTWRALRDRMADEGSGWSPVRSEDLPEGLSDRDEGTRSLEETPSISGSSEGTGPEIPEDVVLRIPESDEVACSSRYGDVAFYEADFNAGVRFPLQPLMRELVGSSQPRARSVGPKCLEVGGWVHGYVEGSEQREGRPYPRRVAFLLQAVPDTGISRLLDSEYASKGFEVDRGEPIVQQGMEGQLSLRRPKLGEDGHNRVLRALHHDEHHFKHFIRPELLASYSFGPEPSEAVLSLQEINRKRMATAKLNREKLKKMMASQQDEAPLVTGKKRKAETSSKKATDERSLLPPPPPAPKAIYAGACPNLVGRDASLACRRAKSAVTKDDLGEYDKVNTDVIRVAGTHSLMKGLTELTVIANRCTQWEEALLKQKVQMSEAAQANQRLTTLVNELTLDRDRVVGELSTLKADLTRKEDDLTRALDDARRAGDRTTALESQLATANVSAVEDFKSSEAFDDNNTKYFLSGFNFLKKQAKEKYPELDFDAFQPFDDDESVMPGDDGNVGPSSHTDDDATS
uniref:Uncharacterized protein n=1 Tax=Fagus sylvatica TaxID=28930 RepID=A0A2N9HB48_FAGSY